MTNLSRLLGGKSTTDTDDWKPDMEAVQAVISFSKPSDQAI